MTLLDDQDQFEEGCGAVTPDDRCGYCRDCVDADDDWREIYEYDA